MEVLENSFTEDFKRGSRYLVGIGLQENLNKDEKNN